MAMSMMETGRATKRADMECIRTLKDLGMRDTGRMTNNMAKAMKPGQRELATRVTTLKVKKKVKANTHGQMDRYTMEGG